MSDKRFAAISRGAIPCEGKFPITANAIARHIGPIPFDKKKAYLAFIRHSGSIPQNCLFNIALIRQRGHIPFKKHNIAR